MLGALFPSRVPAARFAASLFVTFAAAACSPSPFEPCRDCNVVLISVDTLRADHVGAYGFRKPTTPNIDALAKRGVLFEEAIAQSSWTRPAHMSIMTGLHPREHGFVAMVDTRRLDPGVPTIASVLHEKGWTTAGYSGGINMSASFGFGQGFEVYRNNGKFFRDNFEDMKYWLDRNEQKRFFLFFHGYDAHTPYHGDSVDRAALGLVRPAPRHRMRRACRSKIPSRMAAFADEYDAAIHRADRYVGKLLAELDRRGLAKKTIVILLSDHGEEFLEHGRCFHVSTLYREVLHVPLVVVAPGLEPRRVAELVPASVSIAPTIMELTGVGGHSFPGPSLVAAARGFAAPGSDVVSETERTKAGGGDGPVRSLTSPGSKLIRWTGPEKTAVFDSRKDPGEQHPLDDEGRRERLAAELDEWEAGHATRFAARRRGGSGRATAKATATREEGKASAAKEEDAPAPEGAVQPAPSEEDEKAAEEDRKSREEELRSLGYAD